MVLPKENKNEQQSNKRSIAKEIEFIVEEEIKKREAHRNKVIGCIEAMRKGECTPEQLEEIKKFFNSDHIKL